MGSEGGMDLPLYLLFGALTALLLASAFLLQLTSQAREAVDEQAEGLLEAVARAAFSLLPGEETRVDLPPSVGGCGYEFWAGENGLHLRVLDGVRRGKLYSLTLLERVEVENSSFREAVYLRRAEDSLVLSSSPFATPSSPSFPSGGEVPLPPPFYSFAKEHPIQAAALVEAYSRTGREPLGYVSEDGRVLVFLGENLWLEVRGEESGERVGEVERAWVVEEVGEVEGRAGWENCPGVAEAAEGGWVLPSSRALSEFLGRAWKSGGERVRPENLRIRAAAVRTGVGSFPCWRLDFLSGGREFVVYWRMLRWWYAENSPGFLMQGEPALEPG